MNDEKDHGGADAGVRKALQELRDANMSYSLVSNCVTALRLEQAMRDADRALSKPAPVAANASAEARLREALVIARRRIAYLGLFAGKSHEHSNDIDFLPMIDEALSQHPHASDCARDGTIPSGYGEYTPITVSGSTSDRTTDVKKQVRSIINGIYGLGYGTFAGGHQDKSIEKAVQKIVALDAFNVGRR